MRVAPPLFCLVCTLLILSTGCSTTSIPRREPVRPQATAPASSLRTELLLLNIAEASGWVAFTDSQSDTEDTEDYRILIQRESTGEILFESNIPLPRGLRTHGFEMSREDARLIDIASTVDAGILPPLSQFQPAAAPLMPDPIMPDSIMADSIMPDPIMPDSIMADSLDPTVPPKESISVLTGIQVIDATQTTLVLNLDTPDDFQVGDRIFLRTPPETLQDPDTEATVILSRGRISGLLEITEITGSRATATLQSGEIPAEGYLERVTPEL